MQSYLSLTDIVFNKARQNAA